MSENDPKDRRRIEAYKEELAADPGSPVFIALAEALNRTGAFDEAAEVAHRGLEIHDQSVGARLALAVAEAGRGNVRAALEQIKAGLTIDQENPRALALMGTLLLQKGLARRAAQFLGQAVRLAPQTREYADLLRRARRLAKTESPVPLPVVRGDQVQETDSPWTEDGGVFESEPPVPAPKGAEHTVFDPDALKSLSNRQRKSTDNDVSDEEMTQFAGSLDALRKSVQRASSLDNVPVSASQPHESATAFAGPRSGPGKKRRKPKMGGSAADYSKIIQRGGGDASPVERTMAAPPDALAEPATVDGVDRNDVGVPPDGRTSRLDDDALAELRGVRAPFEAPSVRRARDSKVAPPAEDVPAVVARSSRSSKAAPAAPGVSPEGSESSRPATGPAGDRRSAAGGSAAAQKARSRVSKAKSRPSKPASKAARVKSGPVSAPADEPAARDRTPVIRDEGDKAAATPPSSAAAKRPAQDSSSKRSSDGSSAPARAEHANGQAPAREGDASDEASAKKSVPENASAAKPDAKPMGAPPAKEGDGALPDPVPVDPASTGRPSTMFVDDAVWAIYGGERPSPSEPDAGGDAPKPKPKPSKPAAPVAPVPKRRSVLIVRTSETFGRATTWVAIAVAAGIAMWGGYSAAVARSGAAPVEAREEIKGIASDIERGGLASLRAAEDAIGALIPQAPKAKPVLVAALAEVQSRMHADFGGGVESRRRAKENLASLKNRAVSVEALAAQVHLSTTAVGLDSVRRALNKTLERYPESPKAHVLLALIAERSDDPQDALRSLYRAYDLAPERRDTLLALARWHGARGAHRTAFSFYDKLLEQDRLRDDVEALIDRFVLGRVTGADPANNEHESRLAGLIREEVPTVANDEVGRVRLAFAVSTFARQGRDAALGQLESAEAAFESSPAFKSAVGGVLLAAGAWTRAREQFERALALAPKDDRQRVNIARARFGEDAKLTPPKSEGKPKAAQGKLRLPFGTVQYEFGRFEIVTVTPDPRTFPEEAFERAAAAATGANLERKLAALALVERAETHRRNGRTKTAVRLLEDALAKDESVDAAVALGRAYFARKDYEAARRAFTRAVRLDDSSPAARYGLGRALAETGDVLDAMEALEPLARRDMVAPEAYRLLASLKRKRGDDVGALDLLTKVAEVTAQDAGLLVELGRLHHLNGKTDQAIATYKRAAAQDGTLFAVPKRRTRVVDRRTATDLYYLGRVLLASKDRRSTRLFAASAAKEGAPDAAHYFAGRALVAKRRTKKAGRRALKNYLDVAPEGPYALKAARLLKKR